MIRIITFLLLLSPSVLADDPITYSTHIRKIFRDHCNNCHNAGRSQAGLDLSSYAGAIKGSSSGEVLIAGEPQESFLYLVMTHEEEPAMPPGKGKVKQAVLDQMKTWIATGLPEMPEDVADSAAKVSANSTAMAASTSETNLGPSKNSAASPKSDTVFAGTNGNPVTAIAVSPNGNIAAVGKQLQVVLFDLQKQSYLGMLPFPEGEIFSLQFSADGKHLIAGGGTAAQTGLAVIWSTDTHRRTHVVGDEYDVLLGATISPNSNLVLFGGPERLLKIADLASERITSVIKKHTDWITATSFSPEGLIFATADRDGNAYVWETDTRTQLHTLRGHTASITDIDWTSDGDKCLTASEDGTVRVWNMHTGAVESQWMAHTDGTLSLQVGPNDEILTVGRDSFVRRWTLDGTTMAEIQCSSTPTRVAIAGSMIVVGDWSGQVWQWQGDQGLQPLKVPAENITSDATPLLASVAGPEPIAEIAIAAVAEINEPAGMTADVAAFESLPADAAEFGQQLEAAKTTLLQIRSQLAASQEKSPPTRADLVQALMDARQIAESIEQPSAGIMEARIFLKAAFERAQSGNPSESATTGAATSRVNSMGARKQLADVNSSLSKMTELCEAIQTDYTRMDSQISDLTTRSDSLKAEYISVAEQLKWLAGMSAALEQQLNAETD